MKERYNTYECNLCNKYGESQENLLKCIKVLNMKTVIEDIPKYLMEK